MDSTATQKTCLTTICACLLLDGRWERWKHIEYATIYDTQAFAKVVRSQTHRLLIRLFQRLEYSICRHMGILSIEICLIAGPYEGILFLRSEIDI